MASSVIYKQPCVKCEKGGGVATCGGCQQWFCTKHFTEHRQELASEMDHLVEEHDLLQQDLSQHDGTHALLSRVNDWEQIAIKRIQAAAEQARADLKNYFDDDRQQLKSSLHPVTEKLKLGRQSDDYTEIDLKHWLKRINEIRQMHETSLAVLIFDSHEPDSIIHLIRVERIDMSKRTSGSTQDIQPGRLS